MERNSGTCGGGETETETDECYRRKQNREKERGNYMDEPAEYVDGAYSAIYAGT